MLARPAQPNHPARSRPHTRAATWLALLALALATGCARWEGPNVTITDRPTANERGNPVNQPTAHKSNVPIGAAATFARAWDLQLQASSRLYKLDRDWLRKDPPALDRALATTVDDDGVFTGPATVAPPPEQVEARAEVRGLFRKALELYDALASLPRVDLATTSAHEVAPSELDVYRAYCLRRIGKRDDADKLLREFASRHNVEPVAKDTLPSPAQWELAFEPIGLPLVRHNPVTMTTMHFSAHWVQQWQWTKWPASTALIVAHELLGGAVHGFGVTAMDLVLTLVPGNSEMVGFDGWFECISGGAAHEDWTGEPKALDARPLALRIRDYGPIAVVTADAVGQAAHPLLLAEAHVALARDIIDVHPPAGEIAWHWSRAGIAYERAAVALSAMPEAVVRCRTLARTCESEVGALTAGGVTPVAPALPDAHPLLQEHGGDG